MSSTIRIRGARVHNLKNIDVDIPRDAFVVITGLSGSGKSSLAFDTVYAEGQRRYVESLSAYARQFLGLMDKPDVDQIEGLSPAISIDQKSTSHNPRSTVGTVTEIYDYLRLLFARVGHPHCPRCGREVEKQTLDQIASRIESIGSGIEVLLLAPVVRDKKGEHKNALAEIVKAGYARVRFDGVMYSLEEAQDLTVDKKKKHTLDVVVDRLTLATPAGKERDDAGRARMKDSMEQALDLGNGLMVVERLDTKEEMLFAQHLSCPVCGISLPEFEPRDFSFNSPHGACERCSGLGNLLVVDEDMVIPNKRLSLAEGAIQPWARMTAHQGFSYQILEVVAKEENIPLQVPVAKLTQKQLQIILHGVSDKQYKVEYAGNKFSGDYWTAYEGVVPNLERRYRQTESDFVRREIERYMRTLPCPLCAGKRLKPEVLSVTIAGKNISYMVSLSIADVADFFEKLADGKKQQDMQLSRREQVITKQVLKEISARLQFLRNVGLDYLTLDRAAATLSGGEAQRIRLATQIGSALVGVIYILDEPSIGLHQRDNTKLIATLKSLRDLGNTVIVVEHDEETIRSCDWVIDIGPGAGAHGGEVIAIGTPAALTKNAKSPTGRYLSGKDSIALPKKYRKGSGKYLTVHGASAFNLKNIDVAIPLGKFVALTGVSGSGKSTLMTEILGKALSKHFYRAKDAPGAHKGISGINFIDKVITIDQSPIGRTPRSNPATYTGVFTPMRDLFANMPEAKIRGYKSGRFSFNVTGGRCEACQGEGLVKIEMQFLPDVYVECEECHGKRYNQEALEIHYKGKTIADVLEMTVEEAQRFFETIPSIADKLKTMEEVGLGYIHLGQFATTLSGGEAQRVKLSTELSRRSTGKTLYILDEPTTGLHFADVKRLLGVLQALVDKGNTVLVIEHNLDVIKSADWLIDLGPEGGDKGGYVVAVGTPKDVAKVQESFTGQYLQKVL
ncbi:MAG: excinuclease ABC subunit UvrA [Parcubacteria group bacterium CG08_land_8_20_14_0_20_48_21]|nr:MAG: excinuclease ABC subunit A [Parcubacteria group bacterium CG2_30_48_51]PIS32472.1 MAG: excinuclease ABC subunit UvrA [Parcubacteria group bacterium CG08_land_8_20_14_0_20_48_21]PIW78864.1 MAG: excinuclease ABC subunit UvrA [Parcubacteria group bacterium CG_4_8_14_3_um_filter_48_16]PIY78066.1 MAG: excinuclease ABC subunit UvrA [Parcubacteria group bacterium CG_4_10_14_0_8_um_filter_48_154]PIZ77911.1 MAG: excinuclease ABC subunit UvrA [bacterium CG_4_10_14_0_2_um_filter_48_144]PJC39968.1